jgi:hypothetical protein
MNENREYCKRIVDELEAIYNGTETDENGEEITLWDYFSDVLDFDFTVNRFKEYISARIWIGLGGPNVWIDTDDSCVRLAWGSDREEYPLSYDVRDEIDSIFEEYYNCN